RRRQRQWRLSLGQQQPREHRQVALLGRTARVRSARQQRPADLREEIVDHLGRAADHPRPGGAVMRFASPARQAFTLVEMLVALAVLSIAMVVVSNVFGVATKTAAQATALSELTAALRAWEIETREDLNGIDPQRSILVMVGRTVPAARTTDDLNA